MKPKDYLMQIRHAKRRIKEIETEILEIREAMTSLSHGEGSGVHLSNPETRSPQEKLITRLIEHEESLADEQRRYFDLKRLIVAQIDAVDNHVHRNLLYCRYVESKRLEQIAVEMNYCYGHIKRIHGQALQEFGKRYL